MKPFPRIVFYGTPDFAVASLDALFRAGFEVVGVVTAPDREAGRGLTVTQSAVKKYAKRHDLPIYQPERLKSYEFQDTLRRLRPDVQVVVAFRMMPKEVWSSPPLGTFNLHASLLPQYRGAAPINRAIMNGETETGVTTFLINEEIDTGALLMQEKVAIGPDETAGELHDRLMVTGAGLVVETLNGLVSGSLTPVSQDLPIPDRGELKLAPKLHKSDTSIDWNRDTQTIYNQIRGLNPYPGVFSALRLKNGTSLSVKIGSAKISDDPTGDLPEPGSVESDSKRQMKIATLNGYIKILTLQPASKKMMNVAEFLNGWGGLLA